MNILNYFLSPRLRALISKEFVQIRRDRRLAMSLVIAPVIQLVLFGFALNATVSHLQLGVVDDDKSAQSRDLIATMTESGSFDLARTYGSVEELGAALSRGELDGGLIVPVEFDRDLERGRPVQVQILLNAMNANTAAIGQGYAEGVIQSWNQTLTQGNLYARFQQIATNPATLRGSVTLHPAFLFNPALNTTWFTVTGTFGVLLMLNGSLISSASMIKERDRGTVEQLLMTPASTSEIIIAKILPLFVLLCLLVLFAATLLRVIFDVPFRGSIFLVLSGGALCVLCGIGVGTFLATYTKSAQQAQLMAFFINPPLSSLSGSLTPVEAMPKWLQPVTLLNPIRHFSIITRSCLLKGSGLDTLWPNYLALIGFATVLLSLSVRRFRKQLG
jgi:ABC-2 type transport system permease protein